MRIRKSKRILAVVMAFLMVVGSIPVNMWMNIANAEETQVTKTVNFDLSEVAAVDGTSTDFLAGDVPVIANGKVSVKEAATDEQKVINEKGTVYSKWINSGGKGSISKRAMKLVLDTTSEVTVWALSNSAAEKRDWVIADEKGTVLNTYSAAELGSSVSGVTTKLSKGTYYIYTLKSVNFYDIDIQWSMDFALGEAGDIEQEVTAGDFTLVATSAKKLAIDVPDGVTDADGVAFTKRLKLGGTGSSSYRAIRFTLTHTASLDVYALSGGSDERKLKVEGADGKVVVELTVADKSVTAVQPKNVVLPAGTYTIYSAKSGINVYDIRASYSLDFALGETGNIETEAAAGDFTLVATSAKTLAIDVPDGVTDADGVAFTKRLKLGGTGSSSYRAIRFTLDYRTSLDIYALSGGSDERTLKVEGADGKVVAEVSVADKSVTAVQPKTVELAPGTYTIYSAKSGINVYDIRITPDKVQCAWADVAAPTLDGVSVNEENGNFIVKFTGVVDRYEGAEYLMVSMMSNGYEVSSYRISGKETSIEMTPYWNGDYSFKVTAVRSGEAHKGSNVVDVKDFKLRLKQPVFRMLESVGGGSVYVDWVDNQYANAYDVFYKLASDTDDKYVLVGTQTEDSAAIKGLTVGNKYTIKVVAKDTVEGLSSAYSQDIEVTQNAAEKIWNVATTGSNQTVNMTITTAEGVKETHVLSVKDESTDKKSHETATNIVNTTGKIEIAAADDGKISDDEDGFRYYYTMINPNTENFKISATFKITDVSRTPDNQTGFGIILSDILGVNQYGEGTYVHKYHNSLLVGHYSATKNPNAVFKYVTGYNSADASDAVTAERANNTLKFNKGTVEYAEGNTYTFTLEKTNEKFIGTFNGETVELNDTSILSVQEDGSICVGVFSARKVGVEISDIKFETSESTGVTVTEKSDKVAPSTRIYSTNTVGASEYELTYATNVAGTLIVIGPDNKIYPAVNMKADSVARVNVAVAVGNNTIKTAFTPSKEANKNLTSYDVIENTITVERKKLGADGGAIYVAPTGTADGAGTKESPMDLATVVQYARPGQVVVMMDGEYTKSIKIPRSVSGLAGKYITLRAENVGKAVFTGGAGLAVEGSYWHIYGINTVGAAGVGIQIYGNYNILDMCTVQGSGNSGIQISRSGSATNAQGKEGLLWPSHNLIKNCESYDNCDAGRNDADGFAAKLTCGEGNRFYGCISHNNIDDGWDLFAKTVTGEIGVVTIENCIAYDNGWLTSEPGTYSSEGNGFKLGGGYLNGGHILKNSIAFNNRGKGITSNSCPDVEVYNCTSYNNQADGGMGYNNGFNAKASAEKMWKIDGLLSMNVPDNTTKADLISFALQSEKNFTYDGSISSNTAGVVASDSWFESTDVSVKPTRNSDGTIDMHGLLKLTEEGAKYGAGATLVTSGDEAVSTAPAIPEAGASSDIVISGDEKPSVSDVEKSETAQIVDKNGNVISNSDVFLNVSKADADTQKKFEDVLAANGIAIKDGKKVEFLDIALTDATGNSLLLNSGKLYITFAYPEGADKNSAIKVYHLNGDVLEDMPVMLTDAGIRVEVTSLSPFAVVYEVQDEVVTPPTGDATNAAPYVWMTLLSVAALAGIYFSSKKRNIAKR